MIDVCENFSIRRAIDSSCEDSFLSLHSVAKELILNPLSCELILAEVESEEIVHRTDTNIEPTEADSDAKRCCDLSLA